MHPVLVEERAAIADIAVVRRQFRVRRLDVFGSAARWTDFDPARSDVDFLVEFEADPRAARFARWMDPKAGL